MNGLTRLEFATHFTVDAISICYYLLDKPSIDVRQLLPYCMTLPKEIQLSIESRRIEYLAGRYCAVQALCGLGMAAPRVGRNADRSPRWPAGTYGSLSHTDNRVIACAVWQSEYAGVGIDIEKTVPQEMLPSLEHLVFTVPEREWVKTSPGLTVCQAATLLFSAKEAFYKFIYPQVHTHLDFTDLSLVALKEGEFAIELQKELGRGWRKGKVVQGKYFFDDEQVITLIAAKQP
ncbi:4'-phosphopantetheinyl transferase [Serratia sp. DD3]|uniref:4'-phosphopantetheinyl transferase family protein n=1 Tax=Serratia sp. DD3 TaxID=1410619 RepID=UPI0003C50CAB|nr:4'-phosphopantetheinyl transferase superfamily protein [Serratia sp. DD3]KEY56865.1 4'-phosphopantetheinyl transferase Npt [Serratia sp. DD3]